MFKGRIVVVLAALTSCVALAAVAGAATKTVHDPTGDLYPAPPLPGGVGKSDVDITKASAGSAAGKIKLSVQVKGSIAKALAHSETAPVFSLTAKGDFFLVRPSGGGYKVFNQTKPSKPPIHASSKKSDSHTVVFKFKPSAIGQPSKFGWRATLGGCTVYDSAPDTGFATAQARRRC